MTMVLLTLTCGPNDVEPITAALRSFIHAPMHVQQESVLSLDFDGAVSSERVSGKLARVAIEIELPVEQIAQVVATVSETRRRLPVRWRTTAILDKGRIE